MAIKVDKNKQKKITMDLAIEGIEKDKLNFNFRIEAGNCELGFPGRLTEDNKLEIEIPPLKSVGFIKKGEYTASLEVDDNDRYFMKPWEGQVQVESSPEVTAVYEEELGKTSQDSSVKVENISENSEHKKPKKKKKWTKEDAVNFIREAKNRLSDRDPEKVEKYISEVLENKGFKYTPKHKKTKQKNNKNVRENFNKDFSTVRNKQDIIDYLNSKGMKNESSVNYILEKVENETGGDLEKMFDLVKDMMEPNKSTTHENQMQNISNFYQNHSPNDSDKEGLQQRIQQAKAEMQSKLYNS